MSSTSKRASCVRMGRTTIDLQDADLLGEGGEGRVYRYGQDSALKIFNVASPARTRKLEAFPQRLPNAVKGPCELLHDRSSQEVVGYRMQRVAGGFDVGRLSERTFRDRERIGNADVLGVFRALVTVLSSLHAKSVVVGDLNPGNVMLSRDQGPLVPSLIDADSMQYASFACTVAHERYVHPSLYGKDLASGPHFSPTTDRYSLAVLLFESLFFVHPYGGVHPAHPTLLRRAAERVSIFDAKVKIPKYAEPFDILDDAWLAYFATVFGEGHADFPPHTLLDATTFVRCAGCGREHARRACPRCTKTTHSHAAPTSPAALAVHVVHDGGLVPLVAVTSHGTCILHASISGTRLVRESGHVFDLAATLEPGELGSFRVALEARATYVVTDGAAHRFDHDTGKTERFGIGCPKGRASVATTPGEILRIRDGAIERLRAGTRVGAVLEGCTEIFSGKTLAFAFYKLGGLALGFLFSPHTGPLRQVHVPSIVGRVVRTFAHFDDDHVLLGLHVDDGRTKECILHLFDRKGALLASAKGPLDEARVGTTATGPLFAGAARGALHGGRLLVPTEDGLALFAVQQGTFALQRAFPETATLVPAEAELTVDTQGSVYVSSFARIVRLSL